MSEETLREILLDTITLRLAVFRHTALEAQRRQDPQLLVRYMEDLRDLGAAYLKDLTQESLATYSPERINQHCAVFDSYASVLRTLVDMGR
jgi:hypothetical protein